MRNGLLCVVAGISLAGFVPFLNSGFFHMLQLDFTIAALSVSILLAIALHLMTRDGDYKKPEEVIDALRRKVAVLEGKLRDRAKHITDKEAKRIAEGGMQGYKAVKATLFCNEFEVELRSGEKAAKAIIDAWDGEIKQKNMRFEARRFFRDPHVIAGLLIIIAILAATAVFFEGFPDPTEAFTSMFGITMEDVANMSENLRDNPFTSGELPPGCVSPFIFNTYKSQLTDRQFLLDHAYHDNSTRNVFEDKSLDTVSLMLRIDHEGRDVIMAFTESGKECYLTDGTFCGCINRQG